MFENKNYSLRPIILFANVDVYRYILVINTSVLAMGRMEYDLSVYVYSLSTEISNIRASKTESKQWCQNNCSVVWCGAVLTGVCGWELLPLALFSLPSSSAPGNQYKRTDFGNRDHDSSDISNQTEFLPATTKKGSDEPAPVRARASRALLHYGRVRE
jgi:hypothetical protein